MNDPQTTVSEARARSNSNLRPFANGHDSRRANSSNAGASMIEWLNRLENDHSVAEIQAIADSETEPVPKIKAAKSIIRSLRDDFAKNGAPLAANDLDRILDRTHGRAVQRVEVTRKEERDPDAVRLELLTLLAEHPELRAAIAGELPPAPESLT